MATTDAKAECKSGLASRLFVDHPRSLGMGWARHGIGAVAISMSLIGAGAACLIHAFVPGCFTQTAGRTVERMHEHMMRRRADAPEPENWPDYEI